MSRRESLFTVGLRSPRNSAKSPGRFFFANQAAGVAVYLSEATEKASLIRNGSCPAHDF